MRDISENVNFELCNLRSFFQDETRVTFMKPYNEKSVTNFTYDQFIPFAYK